jgi:protein gp37
MAQRLKGRCGYPKDLPFRPGTFHEDKLLEPMTRHKPQRVFVCSMGDLFHPRVGWNYLDKIFAVMAVCQTQTFLVLTKRPRAMRQYIKSLSSEIWRELWPRTLQDMGVYDPRQDQLMPPRGARRSLPPFPSWPLPNVWFGVSVEDQRTADERIPTLLQTPAAVRFVSCEPLLGPTNLAPHLEPSEWDLCPAHDYGDPGYPPKECPDCHIGPSLDWVIVGGETGPNARPMHPDWARSLRDQCQEAGVPFFFKQQGEWAFAGAKAPFVLSPSGELWQTNPTEDAKGWWPCARVGKKAAGRLLDGREWNQWPEVTA